MKTSLICIALALLLATAHAFPGLRSKPKRRIAAWDELSAQSKLDNIWANIVADESSWPWPSKLKVATIFVESMDPTFDYVSDVLPAGRQKLIHSVGRVSQFNWVPTPNNTYTGGFAGTTTGILRMSFALEPTEDGIIPAVAFKFLRDGVPSGDYMSLNLVNGIAAQQSFNFFSGVFTNHLPEFTGIEGTLLAKKFATASTCGRAVGLTNIALVNNDGSQVADYNSPFQLFMVPLVSFPDSESNLDNWDSLFAGIGAGTALFDIHALRYPDSSPEHIATVYTSSDVVPSFYGDTQLFFEHQRMDGPTGDFAYNPEWAQHGLDKASMCTN